MNEEDMKILSISGKLSAPGSDSKFPQKKSEAYKYDDEDDDDFKDEEAKKKLSKEKCVRYSSQKYTKIKPEWK